MQSLQDGRFEVIIHKRADGIETLGQDRRPGLQVRLEKLKGHLGAQQLFGRVGEDLAVVRPRAENGNFHPATY